MAGKHYPRHRTEAEMHRVYADLLDACANIELEAWQCIKFKGEIFEKPLHFSFNGDPKDYEFAIAIIDGKPYFESD